MSPSVYAVLRENLSPTTIETAVCSLSFLLLVRGMSNEAKVVCESKGLKFCLGCEEHVYQNKSVSITQRGSCTVGPVLLVSQALRADTFAYLNCSRCFHQSHQRTKYSRILLKYTSSSLLPTLTPQL